MDPDFEDIDNLYSSNRFREFGGTAINGVRLYMDKVYQIFDRDMSVRYRNHDSSSWYQTVGPHWLQKELKRLFPEGTNPLTPIIFNDQGRFNYWGSGLFVLDDDGKKEECRILGCYAVWLLSGPTFGRNPAPPSRASFGC
jgi:hypothetical protein